MTIEQMLARKRELGYTYEMIAEKSGIPISTVQKILGGFTETPRYDNLIALEKVLGYSTSLKETELLKTTDYAGGNEEYNYNTRLSRITGDIEGYIPQKYISDKKQGEYTVADLDRLPEDVRAELIDGVIFDIAAPNTVHQYIVTQLSYQINKYIEDNDGDCFVLVSPSDVRLDCSEKTSVQPDVFVVCDADKFRNGKVFGAPDLCIEVLSPSTEKKDKWIKLNKYKKCGVREYWLIDIEGEGVLCYDYMNGRFETYTLEEKVPVAIYGGELKINFLSIAAKLHKFK